MSFPSIFTFFTLAFTLSLGVVNASQAQNRDVSAGDSVLLDMALAYKAHDYRRLVQLLPQAQGHILEPWAAYWTISSHLDEVSQTEIEAFLNRYADTYQEDRLRNDWLLILGKNRDWVTFNRELAKYRMNDDKSVRCYALLSDHLTNKTDVNLQVQTNWLALKDTDDGCSLAAGQLIQEQVLSTHVAWLRARMGMENDHLHIATQAVGLLNDKWLKTVNTIYLNPAHYLNDKLTALRPQTRELVSLAIIRLAYLDPAQAADEVNKLRWKAQLNQEERNWIWGAIGRRAAQKLSPDALSYFANAQLTALPEEHLTWLVRSALRAGNWSRALEGLGAMSAQQRSETRWVYWQARGMLKLSTTESSRNDAMRLLESIAGTGGFYEQLALEELGRPISLPAKPLPFTREEKLAAQQNAGLQRALTAISIGLRNEGVREWNYTVGLRVPGGMDDRALLAAADLACQNEVWDRCINTSERTKGVVDIVQRFPMPFRNEVVSRANEIGLDPAYVYGLIRQESRFIMDAHSGVGASGLMQLMPATAKWTAKKIGITNYSRNLLNERDVNIALGTGYLKLVLDNFGGSYPLATAAYNAGPNRPRVWRGQGTDPSIEGAIWAENIPFRETRDYVQKVLSNTTLYAAIISAQPQSLKARLGTVGPLLANAPVQMEDLP